MTADMQIPTDLTPEQLAAVAHLLPTGPCTIRIEPTRITPARTHFGSVELLPFSEIRWKARWQPKEPDPHS